MDAWASSSEGPLPLHRVDELTLLTSPVYPLLHLHDLQVFNSAYTNQNSQPCIRSVPKGSCWSLPRRKVVLEIFICIDVQPLYSVWIHLNKKVKLGCKNLFILFQEDHIKRQSLQ